MPKYALVEEAAAHCWGKGFLEVFRAFFARHAETFRDAPAAISGEQNMEYYELYQDYLRLYENTLSDYIESLDVTIEEFYAQLAAVKSDPEIKDKKLLHFVNYLLACTDYTTFYKVMARAAKKVQASDMAEEKGSARAESKPGGGGGDGGSKAEGKGVAGDSKAEGK